MQVFERSPFVLLLVGSGVVSAFQVGKATVALAAVQADLGMNLAVASWLLSGVCGRRSRGRHRHRARGRSHRGEAHGGRRSCGARGLLCDRSALRRRGDAARYARARRLRLPCRHSCGACLDRSGDATNYARSSLRPLGHVHAGRDYRRSACRSIAE
jgi:hypothetical protein